MEGQTNKNGWQENTPGFAQDISVTRIKAQQVLANT